MADCVILFDNSESARVRNIRILLIRDSVHEIVTLWQLHACPAMQRTLGYLQLLAIRTYERVSSLRCIHLAVSSISQSLKKKKKKVFSLYYLLQMVV